MVLPGKYTSPTLGHWATGYLLFGPLGTGKILVVRMLATEVRGRMPAVLPLDVIDIVSCWRFYPTIVSIMYVSEGGS